MRNKCSKQKQLKKLNVMLKTIKSNKIHIQCINFFLIVRFEFFNNLKIAAKIAKISENKSKNVFIFFIRKTRNGMRMTKLVQSMPHVEQNTALV